MTKTIGVYTRKFFRGLWHHIVSAWFWFTRYWHKNWWHKGIVCIIVVVALCIGTMYGIARWYIWQQSSQPLTMGVTFVPDYAESLGLNPKTTFEAILNDLDVKQVRLTSYWSDIEPTKGHYNFSMLDWEFAQADTHHAKVTLSIGLRQPRWPECHPPSWAANEPESVWYPQLAAFMAAVINRYKNNPALQSYQLENEYFLQDFGECTNYSRTRLINEYNLVKHLDPSHPIIMSRSNNYGGLALGQPRPSEYGISVYRRVWVPFLHMYAEYPFPAWYYAFLAGAEELATGRNSILHELQAEPWTENGASIPNTSLKVQNESMNPTRLKQTIQFGKATGLRTIDLWGAEYWYYRMVKFHDPSLWNIAKQAIRQANAANPNLSKN